MPIVIWFSAVSALLQHWGILQPLVALVGGGVKLVVGTSTVECFVAVANIFFGPVRLITSLDRFAFIRHKEAGKHMHMRSVNRFLSSSLRGDKVLNLCVPSAHAISTTFCMFAKTITRRYDKHCP